MPAGVLDELWARDPDERLPIASAHKLLESALELTGDPNLGLEAAREIELGDIGAPEYAASSMATLGEALALSGRFMRLSNDALQYSVEVEGERAAVRLDSRLELPRAAADFQTAAFWVIVAQRWNPQMAADVEVWFTYPAPESTLAHERALAPSSVRFGAPFSGLVFDKRYLDMPQASADPRLHELMRRHTELMLAELPGAETLAQKVRDLIAKDLASGNVRAVHVARQLQVSPRTLGRGLAREGTTFTALLEDMRCRAARRYVGNHDLSLGEIAFLLGFSDSGAFHRAFKRWTSMTPLDYRRGRRAKRGVGRRIARNRH